MLIEIHMTQNHAPSNLNRDDTGSPKEAMFGGWKRARISSQCLKRSIRRSDIFTNEIRQLARRTRRLPELVRERLIADGIAEDIAEVAARKVSGFGTAAGSEREADGDGTYTTAQTMFLTEADIAAVTEVVKAAAQKAGSAKAFDKVAAKELQSQAQPKGYRPITVDIALFGRMVTSEAFRDCEASAQVAHAVSTHKVSSEYDYFTAVDDLQGSSEDDEDAGADMIGDVEFNSACYYKYFSVDFGGFVDNLTGKSAGRKDVTADEEREAAGLAARAVDALLRSAILTTPSGKQNTFGAHQLPAAVLVEVRPYNTPVNYANAFVEPARSASGRDVVTDSVDRLAKHMSALAKGFNLEASARFVLAPEHPAFSADGIELTRVDDLKTLCEQLRGVICNG
jgi:CRISPR system Cascade subunit CasC